MKARKVSLMLLAFTLGVSRSSLRKSDSIISLLQERGVNLLQLEDVGLHDHDSVDGFSKGIM